VAKAKKVEDIKEGMELEDSKAEEIGTQLLPPNNPR
jgi:hypothetical protein